MSDSEIKDVSDTALWVAVYRAKESERKDGLFKDPYAAMLTGDRGREIESKMVRSQYVNWTVVIRTVIIDNYLQKLISEGVDTIINLGAGLDTRPYRMNLPENLNWIEVDFPHMIRMKEKKLANEKPKCKLERISLDLSKESLRQELFQTLGVRSDKIAIITEGVTPYLTNEEVGSLAKDLHAQKNFRYWICDYLSPLVTAMLLKDKKRQALMKNAPFKFNPSNWFSFFHELGWKPREMRYIPEESMRLGRDIPAPWFMKILHVFLSKKHKERFLKSTAYALLERL